MLTSEIFITFFLFLEVQVASLGIDAQVMKTEGYISYEKLKNIGTLKRTGPDKGGYWEVMKRDGEK